MMTWAAVAMGILTACGACHSSKAPSVGQAIAQSDTTYLYQKDTLFSVGAEPTVLPILLAPKDQAVFKKNQGWQNWLLLYRPQVIQMPDGVYEIYLTTAPPTDMPFTPELPGFVGVLNLYDQTGPDAKAYVAINLNAYLQKIERWPSTPFYIVFHFAGNRLANGTSSQQAGKIQLSGLHWIQTRQ